MNDASEPRTVPSVDLTVWVLVMRVIRSVPNCFIAVPSAFSPNGDGTNAPCFSCAISIALQQELGVKLVKRAIQLDVIVVDHAEKTPTDN